MDASSKYQDSLPVSSDALLDQLRDWGIAFELFKHVPLFTVAESKLVQGMFLTNTQGGGHIKNLYLRDKKKRNYLVVAEQDREIDLKALGETIGAGRLSFGSPDRLLEYLGVRPGAVTPLAMLNGHNKGVAISIDASLLKRKIVYAHPLVNDRTIALTPDNLVAFFDHVGCAVNWVDLN